MQPTTSLEISCLAEGDFRDMGLAGTRLVGLWGDAEMQCCGHFPKCWQWNGTQSRSRQETKFLSFLIAYEPELSLQPSPATTHCFLFTLQTGKATLSTAPLQIFYTQPYL